MDNSAITEIDPWIRYPVVLVFVAFIFVIVGYGAARNRRRFQRFARRHGLRYLDNDRWGVEAPPDSMLASLGPMGTDAQMRAATEGAIDGHEVSVFECAYAREHGATKGYPVTVVQIDTGISLPHFTLRPEKLRHKLAAIAGKDDIDLAECPSFSKRFLLRGEAPSALRDLFARDICQLIEQDPSLFAESCGNLLLLYHRPHMFQYSKFRERDIELILQLGLKWTRLLTRTEETLP